jgi:hypothetical protein
MAPRTPDPSADLRARLVAYAQIGTLSELCLAWHQGDLAMARSDLVDSLSDLFVRMEGAYAPPVPEHVLEGAPNAL